MTLNWLASIILFGFPSNFGYSFFPEASMALKGDLRDFTITQLLNLINLAQKTGTLIIESPSETITLSFHKGKLSYAQAGSEENSLASILYQTKLLTSAQYQSLKQRSGNMGDKELGLLLINANYTTQQEILSSLQTHYIKIINRLFTWVEGLFRFENNLVPPDDKILVRVSLENIIIEGSRRMREWEQLKDEIPSLEMSLKFADRPGTNIQNFSLNVEEWRVVSYINPKNTIRQIAQTTKISELEIRRIIYGLLQAGLIEIVRPAGRMPPKQVQKRFQAPQANQEEQKSLIHRIISRIKSL